MGIYQSIFNIIVEYVYGNSVALTADQELTCTLISTLGCLFVVALPFLVVWRVVSLICSRW
ncbi:MAG: hypothetical protein IJ301_04395 [Clostridia bacterium]|nr:hypothetical protein [Clostridia bacterium]